VPLTIFAEHGQAYDRLDRNRERWRSDTRAGFLFYKEWNAHLPCESTAAPYRFVSDFYADAIYFSRYDGNWISYLRFRPGYRLYEDAISAVDGYLHLANNTDTQNVSGNRFYESGLGVAFRLYVPLRLAFRVSALQVHQSAGLSSYGTVKFSLEYESRF
jgi:hypothetical protein